MEMSLSSFARDFLECVLGEPLTQKQLDLFLALARRGKCMEKLESVGTACHTCQDISHQAL